MISTTKKNINSNIGSTLVELILYMALSMIFLTIVSGLFISILSIRNESIKTSSLEREGRYMMARLSHDAYSAEDILEPALLGLGSTSTTLQLMKNAQLQTYRIIGDKLYLIDNAGSHLLSGEAVNVTSFSVTRLGNEGGKNAIEVNLTAQSQVVSEGKNESRNYQTLMSIR